MQMPKPSVAHALPKAVMLLESMVEELRCPLCFEVFHEPRTLGCMHTFCADCLASLIIPTFSPNKPGAISRTEYLKFIECPLCRRNQELGPDGVDGLPRHHAISNLALKYRQAMTSLEGTDSSLDLLRSRTPSPMPMHRPKSPASEDHFEDEEEEAVEVAKEERGNASDAEQEAIVPKKPAAAAAASMPTYTRILVNHLRFRLRPDEAPDLVRKWLESLNWVPTEFHKEVVIGAFTRHFVPFYQFDVQCRSEVVWNSVFVFADLVSTPQSLTVNAKHSVYVLASSANLYTYLAEELVRWDDKLLKHLILSKIPVEILLPAEDKWRDDGEKRALTEARKRAEERIPPPSAFYRHENAVVQAHIEGHQPRVVVYPLYYGTYKFRDSEYRVVVDAFTKEVTGEKPFGLRNRKWRY